MDVDRFPGRRPVHRAPQVLPRAPQGTRDYAAADTAGLDDGAAAPAVSPHRFPPQRGPAA